MPSNCGEDSKTLDLTTREKVSMEEVLYWLRQLNYCKPAYLNSMFMPAYFMVSLVLGS